MIDFSHCDYDADTEYLREYRLAHAQVNEERRRFFRGIVIGGVLCLAAWLGIILVGIHLVHWMEKL